MKKEVTYSKQARNFLNTIPKQDSAIIESKVEQYAEDPTSLQNNVKKLQGFLLYRLRVGKYRVIFDDNRMVVYVEIIGLRSNVYKELKKWQ